MSVWGFKDNRSVVYNSVQMFRPISNIVSMNKVVFLSFKSNDIQKFRFNDDLEELQFVKTELHLEHDKSVTDIDCHIEKQLLISGSIDGLVKIWNIKKELIREIKFPEEVYAVSFLNSDGDIIVGHKGKVSTVSKEDYQPHEISKLYMPKDLDLFYARKS